MNSIENKNKFDNLDDVARWKFLRTLSKDEYTVIIDNDCTYVQFYGEKDDTIGDFDFYVGNTHGVKHLLTLLNINFEDSIMTVTDIENYENAIEELNECLDAEVLDYDRIKRLELVIAQYEQMIYA